jgi:hypothetical protein
MNSQTAISLRSILVDVVVSTGVASTLFLVGALLFGLLGDGEGAVLCRAALLGFALLIHDGIANLGSVSLWHGIPGIS